MGKQFLLNETVRLFVIISLFMGILVLPVELLSGLVCISFSFLWVALYIIIEAMEYRELLHSLRRPRRFDVLNSGKRLKAEVKVEEVKEYFTEEDLVGLFNDNRLEQFEGLKDNSKFD